MPRFWEIVYASLLHDIGKVIQRTGYNAKHQELSSRFVLEYSDVLIKAGIDAKITAELTRLHHYEREGLRIPERIRDDLEIVVEADRCSASYRSESIRPAKAAFTAYVSPLWLPAYVALHSDIDPVRLLEASEACRSVVPLEEIDIDALIERIKAKPCSDAESRYDVIEARLRLILNRIRSLADTGIFDPETLYITLRGVLEPLLVFVPDALYGVAVPDSSLAGHMFSAAAIASALARGGHGYRIMRINIYGIQGYIQAIARARGALRQLRGRSLLLQLLTLAITHYVLRKLGLPETAILSYRADNVDLIVPADVYDRIEEIRKDVEEIMVKITGGAVGVAIGVSSVVEKCRYHEPNMPGYYSENSFAKAYSEAEEDSIVEKHRGFSRIPSEWATEGAHLECGLCRLPLHHSNAVKLSELGENIHELLHVDPDIEYMCPACFYSQILGTSAERLVYVVEVSGNNIAEKLASILHVRGLGFVATYENQSRNLLYKVGFIFLPWFDEAFIVISAREGEESVLRAVLDMVAEALRGTRINIYRVNKPYSAIPAKNSPLIPVLRRLASSGARIAFTHIYTNFTLTRNSIDEVAFVETMEKTTMLAWARIDLDKSRDKLSSLISSPTRYLSGVLEIHYLFSLIPQFLLEKKIIDPFTGDAERLGDHVIVVFSGGDDVFIIGRFYEVEMYLRMLQEAAEKYMGRLILGSKEYPLGTISGGLIFTEPKYPAQMGHKDSYTALIWAKEEGRNRLGMHIRLLVTGTDKNITCIKSIPWTIYRALIDIASEGQITRLISRDKTLYYKLLDIVGSLVDEACNIGVPEKLYPILIRGSVAYTYIYNRTYKMEHSVKRLLSKLSLKKELSELRELTPENIPKILAENPVKLLYLYSLLAATLRIILTHIREGAIPMNS